METLVMRRIQVAQVNGVSCGSLVVKAPDWKKGETTTIRLLDGKGIKGQAFYAEVAEYRNGAGENIYAAVFPTLPPGNYHVSRPGTIDYEEKTVTVFPGCIAEVIYT